MLNTVFGALADPTRRAILDRLAAGEATVGELAEPFAMSLPAVSRHLSVLESAGLIRRGRRAQWRVCSLRGDALDEAGAYITALQRSWALRFDRLDAALEAAHAPGADVPAVAPTSTPTPIPTEGISA